MINRYLCKTPLILLVVMGCLGAQAEENIDLRFTQHVVVLGEQAKLQVPLSDDQNVCGFSLDWGDGTRSDYRTYRDLKPPFVVSHEYTREGSFGLRIKGKKLLRGLRSALACDIDNFTQVVVTKQKKAPPPLDLVASPPAEKANEEQQRLKDEISKLKLQLELERNKLALAEVKSQQPIKAERADQASSTQPPPTLGAYGRQNINKLLKEKKYEQANEELRKYLESNDSFVLAQYGYNLANGRGVSADLSKGTEMMKRAIELGYKSVIDGLGQTYLQNRMYSDAKYWGEKASGLKIPGGNLLLSILYASGKGVAHRDLNEAQRYIDLAYEQTAHYSEQSGLRRAIIKQRERLAQASQSRQSQPRSDVNVSSPKPPKQNVAPANKLLEQCLADVKKYIADNCFGRVMAAGPQGMAGARAACDREVFNAKQQCYKNYAR